MPGSRLPRSDSPNLSRSNSPPRQLPAHYRGKLSPPPPKSSPKSPATEPISPEEISKMIALLKHTIPNKDVLEVVINEFKKNVVKQRIKWEKLKNKKYFDISTLKYGPRGYN